MSRSDWSRYALVLVDLQADFWPPEVAATAPNLPARAAQLLRFSRSNDLLVVHVRASFQPDGSDWMARYRLRGRIPCVEGTPGIEVLTFAVELPGEPVVVKHSFDGFLGTDLNDTLRSRGIQGLLIAGLVTSTCVLFTAATATQLGYLVTVVSDCCADYESSHDAALAAYPFIFGTVLSTELLEHREHWDSALSKMNPS